jgi:uncharacterized MAPEG superfamily protein
VPLGGVLGLCRKKKYLNTSRESAVVFPRLRFEPLYCLASIAGWPALRSCCWVICAAFVIKKVLEYES